MTNSNQPNELTNSTSYVVQSSAFVRADFGSVDLPSMPDSLAIMIGFHGGNEYVYLAVPPQLYNTLEFACQEHIATEGQTRIGSLFNRLLFNSYPCYARLHQPNIEV